MTYVRLSELHGVGIKCSFGFIEAVLTYFQSGSFLTCSRTSWYWEKIMFPLTIIRLYFILKGLKKHKID